MGSAGDPGCAALCNPPAPSGNGEGLGLLAARGGSWDTQELQKQGAALAGVVAGFPAPVARLLPCWLPVSGCLTCLVHPLGERGRVAESGEEEKEADLGTSPALLL